MSKSRNPCYGNSYTGKAIIYKLSRPILMQHHRFLLARPILMQHHRFLHRTVETQYNAKFLSYMVSTLLTVHSTYEVISSTCSIPAICPSGPRNSDKDSNKLSGSSGFWKRQKKHISVWRHSICSKAYTNSFNPSLIKIAVNING